MEQFDIGKNNYLVRFYNKFFRGKKVLFFLFIFLFSFILPFIYASMTGTLFKSDTNIQGFVEDTSFFLELIGVPFLIMFFINYCEKVAKNFISLPKGGNIIFEKNKYNKLLMSYKKKYNAKWINIAIIPAALLNIYWMNFHFSNQGLSWQTRYLQNGVEILNINGVWYALILTAFFYLLAYVVIYNIYTISFIKKIAVQGKIKVDPLHPDGSGGLAKIGNLSLINSYPIIIVGLAIAAWILASHYVFGSPFFEMWPMIATFFYVVISSLLFFFPLKQFHQPMLKERDKLLLGLISSFNERDEMLINNKENLMEILSELETIKASYDLADKMPIWPFNFGLVRRFFLTAIVSPIGAFLLPYLIDKYILIF